MIKNFKSDGKKLVYNNCPDLYRCFSGVFVNKKLANKLVLRQWPKGSRNDYAYEAVKLLHYVFRKLDYVITNDTARILAKYNNVVDNLINLISISIRYTKINKNLANVFKQLLNKFGEIKDIVADPKKRKYLDDVHSLEKIKEVEKLITQNKIDKTQIVEKLIEKIPEKSLVNPIGKLAEKHAEKQAEKQAEKPAEKPAEKTAEKQTDNGIVEEIININTDQRLKNIINRMDDIDAYLAFEQPSDNSDRVNFLLDTNSSADNINRYSKKYRLGKKRDVKSNRSRYQYDLESRFLYDMMDMRPNNGYPISKLF